MKLQWRLLLMMDSYNDLVGNAPGGGHLELGKNNILIRFGVQNDRFDNQSNVEDRVATTARDTKSLR